MAYIIRIIPAVIIFFKIQLSLGWKYARRFKTGAVKTRKLNDVAENENKVILCDILETTWNDDDCCSNIVICPNVADAIFKVQDHLEVKYTKKSGTTLWFCILDVILFAKNLKIHKIAKFNTRKNIGA